MHSLKWRLQLILAVAAGCFGLASAISAAPPVYVETRNPYLYADLGVSGDCTEGRVAGRWLIGTVIGNPDVDADDNLPMIYPSGGSPCNSFGYTTVRIDSENLVFGQSTDAAWTLSPYKVAQGWALTGTWQHTASNVSVTLNLSIVRDQARFEWTIKNNDTVSHTVGLRNLGDEALGGTEGANYPFVPGLGFINRETDLTGNQIPDWFDNYNDPTTPTITSRNILREQDATPPDRVGIGEFSTLVSDGWQYTPILDKAVNNWAWATWWNPVVLSPGQERTIVAYFGVSAANESWTSGPSHHLDPFCVALQAPLALSYSGGILANNGTFDVKGYVYNLYHDVTLTNVTADLNLPNGLELVDNTPRTQNVNMGPGTAPGQILPEMESAPIVWKVRVTGAVSGPLTFSMSVTGTGALVKQVSRTIVVPATLSTKVVGDWQLLTMPFQFQDPIPLRALTFDPPVQQYSMSTYDADNPEGYVPVTAMTPGHGFWFRIDEPAGMTETTLALGGEAKALDGTTSYLIDLKPGWNIFGNPFVYPIYWGRISVLNGTSYVSLDEAVARGWIRKVIFWWDTDKQDYSFSQDRETQLLPFRGYWIKALVPCQLMIPPVDQIGGEIAVTTQAAAAAAVMRAVQPASGPYTKDNWQLQMVAHAGGASNTGNLLGVSTRAADGYDSSDVERPPSFKNYVSVAFPHRDWGTNSGSFLRDIRRSVGTEQSWDMEVTTDMKNTDVVLTWPDLVRVPKGVVLKLVDVDGNVTKHLRTTSSYRYNSGTATTRRFRVIAEPATAGRLLISALNVGQSRATGAATVSYSLSTDASSDVRVRTLSGKVLRNLALGKTVTRGISSLSWNYRSDSGEPVPVGSYIVEVVATTPEGEVAKAVRPFIVAR